MDTLAPASAVRPLAALRDGPPGVLAVIAGIEGPSYRPLGAMMALRDGRARVGSLSSGCVEGDIALHAEAALAEGRPRRLRYGLGSPFRDIELPCGGGLDIVLVPAPDRAVLGAVLAAHARRDACALALDPETGALALSAAQESGWRAGQFHTAIAPEIAFQVYGKGPEASTFAALARAAGFPVLLLSPDDETLTAAQAAGCATRQLVSKRVPDAVTADAHTAAVLFFHDHDWEPPLLAALLDGPAFYIGAQGSRRARLARDAALAEAGVAEAAIARLKGPIGLVPSARDARTLAVSVLADVLAAR